MTFRARKKKSDRFTGTGSNRSGREIQPESLLQLAPIRTLLTDPEVRLTPRAVDCTWRYENLVGANVTGFRPYENQVFYGAKSCLADWLKDPAQGARGFNFEDRLVHEALFAAHDYLHVWAYGVIRELKPRLGLGWAPITEKNIEDLVFCHLITEAVATVGLDYWVLGQIDINEICPIGTCIQTLTTAYHRRYDQEYSRLNPDLRVDSEEFFTKIATFYCTGILEGFSIADLKRSPRTFKWIAGELEYGELQRSYIRQWLTFLSHQSKGLHPDRKPDEQGLQVDSSWRKGLIREVGNLLWRKVRREEAIPCPKLPVRTDFWQSPAGRSPDFRFLNVNSVGEGKIFEGLNRLSEASYQTWFDQYLSGFDFARFDRKLLKKIPQLRASHNLPLIRNTLGEQPRLRAGPEPKDIFFPG